MGKASRNKKGKVPKITEEEYAAYVSALKSAPAERNASVTEGNGLQPPPPSQRDAAEREI